METKLNFDREINKIAAKFNMQPGDKKVIEVNITTTGNGEIFKDIIFHISTIELKEGKNHSTRLRMRGKVEYPDSVKVREIVPWEIERATQLEILNIISK